MPTRQTTRYRIRRVYVQSGPDQGVQAFPVDPPLAPYEVELDMADPEDPVTSSSPTRRLDEAIAEALAQACK